MTRIADPPAAGPGGPAKPAGPRGPGGPAGAGRTGLPLGWRLALPARGQEKGG